MAATRGYPGPREERAHALPPGSMRRDPRHGLCVTVAIGDAVVAQVVRWRGRVVVGDAETPVPTPGGGPLARARWLAPDRVLVEPGAPGAPAGVLGPGDRLEWRGPNGVVVRLELVRRRPAPRLGAARGDLPLFVAVLALLVGLGQLRVALDAALGAGIRVEGAPAAPTPVARLLERSALPAPPAPAPRPGPVAVHTRFAPPSAGGPARPSPPPTRRGRLGATPPVPLVANDLPDAAPAGLSPRDRRGYNEDARVRDRTADPARAPRTALAMQPSPPRASARPPAVLAAVQGPRSGRAPRTIAAALRRAQLLAAAGRPRAAWACLARALRLGAWDRPPRVPARSPRPGLAPVPLPLLRLAPVPPAAPFPGGDDG